MYFMPLLMPKTNIGKKTARWRKDSSAIIIPLPLA
jgi:hypothetical protein